MSVAEGDGVHKTACPVCGTTVYYVADSRSVMCSEGDRVAVGNADWYLALKHTDHEDIIAGGFDTHAVAMNARDAATRLLGCQVETVALTEAEARERAR